MPCFFGEAKWYGIEEGTVFGAVGVVFGKLFKFDTSSKGGLEVGPNSRVQGDLS